jgi:hypothetical protein
MATTTPNYGWDVPTSSDYVKNGATAIETLGDDIDATLWTALGGNYPGLRLIKKQTIGTTVSTVSVTGAFSTDYENYLIIVSGGAGSTTSRLRLTLGATATGYFWAVTGRSWSSGTATYAQAQNTTSWGSCGTATTNGINSNVTLFSPFTATRTAMKAEAVGISSVDEYQQGAGYLDNTTSYTAFTFTPSVGTLTGGTIYVYGYGAS